MSVDAAVAAADAQCYRAKALGKNNVQVEAPVHGGPDPLDVDGDIDLDSREGGPG